MFLHYNVQGVFNKVEELEIFLSNFKAKNKVLMLTEHWLGGENREYLNNLGLEIVTGFFRETGERGGSCILVEKNLRNNVKVSTDYDMFAIKNTFESCVAEIRFEDHIFILICIYRVPNINNFSQFCIQLELLLSQVMKNEKTLKKKIVLGGDLNINTLVKDKFSENLLDIIYSFGLHANFNEPTRYGRNSRTCIDHIFTNFTSEQCRIMDPGLSDHTIQFITFPIGIKATNYKTFKRKFTDENISLFQRELKEETWENLYSINQNDTDFVNKIFQKFLEIFLLYFNQSFPKKPTCTNSKNYKKKWLTDEIVVLSAKKRELYQQSKISCERNQIHLEYKKCKQILRNKIRLAKSELNSNYINRAENISKATWIVVKQELGNSRKGNSKIEVEVGDGVVLQEKAAANTLNYHYINTVRRLKVKPCPDDAVQFCRNYKCNVNETLFLAPTTTEEVISAIKKIKNQQAGMRYLCF